MESQATDRALDAAPERGRAVECSSPATGYRLLSSEKEHRIKSPCPYCGGGLRISINGAELDEATGWIATELAIDCETEPDIDGPEWEGWWDDHSWDHCEKWHDLHERVVRSLRRTHRVTYDNGQGETGPLK